MDKWNSMAAGLIHFQINWIMQHQCDSTTFRPWSNHSIYNTTNTVLSQKFPQVARKAIQLRLKALAWLVKTWCLQEVSYEETIHTGHLSSFARDFKGQSHWATWWCPNGQTPVSPRNCTQIRPLWIYWVLGCDVSCSKWLLNRLLL